MNIYLCYIINAIGTRMGQFEFDQLCLRCEWNDQVIRIALTENGWHLDTDWGIDMSEAINMSKARNAYGHAA